MGVEYVHFLVARDPHHYCSSAQIEALVAFLRQHRLFAVEPHVEDWNDSDDEIFFADHVEPDGHQDYIFVRPERHGLTGRSFTTVPTLADDMETIVSVEGSQDAGALRDAFGIDDDRSYVQQVQICSGPMYKLHPSSECHYMNMNADRSQLFEVEATGSIRPPYDYASPESRPVDFWSELDLAHQADFDGMWRFAMVFDFGKCLPAFAETQRFDRPDFVSGLTQIAGTDFLQIGHYH